MLGGILVLIIALKLLDTSMGTYIIMGIIMLTLMGVVKGLIWLGIFLTEKFHKTKKGQSLSKWLQKIRDN